MVALERVVDQAEAILLAAAEDGGVDGAVDLAVAKRAGDAAEAHGDVGRPAVVDRGAPEVGHEAARRPPAFRHGTGARSAGAGPATAAARFLGRPREAKRELSRQRHRRLISRYI